MTTLESFVVTPETRFAHAVAVAVIDFPGDFFNPVVLYGGPGAGKSHLLQAIASALHDRGVRLISASELAADVRTAAATQLVGCDILVDDVDDFSTFAEIRQTLTEVVEHGRQVVVATHPESEAYSELRSWGATHDQALAVDCWRPADLDMEAHRFTVEDLERERALRGLC